MDKGVTPSGSGLRPFGIEPVSASRPEALVPDADLQTAVGEWAVACFGVEVTNDQLERADRFTEESLELAQTMPGFTAERAHALVDYVFGRPVGARHQEVGGVMVTLAALCNATGIRMDQEAHNEVLRIWGKIETIRAKQAAKPHGSALPIAQAGEAEGGDATTGSVHEHAAPEGSAPNV